MKIINKVDSTFRFNCEVCKSELEVNFSDCKKDERKETSYKYDPEQLRYYPIGIWTIATYTDISFNCGSCNVKFYITDKELAGRILSYLEANNGN